MKITKGIHVTHKNKALGGGIALEDATRGVFNVKPDKNPQSVTTWHVDDIVAVASTVGVKSQRPRKKS